MSETTSAPTDPPPVRASSPVATTTAPPLPADQPPSVAEPAAAPVPADTAPAASGPVEHSPQPPVAQEGRPRHGQHAAPPVAEPPVGRRSRLVATWTDGLGAFSMRCLQVLIVATAAAAVVIAAVELKVVVIPILISLIIAAAFNPVTRWLERHGWPRALAALSTLLMGLIVLGGVLVGIALAVIAQWASLVAAASGGIDRIERWIASSGLPIDQQQFENARRTADAFFTNGSFAATALAGLSTATSLITGLILMLFVLFFFLKDGAMIWRFVLTPFHGPFRGRAERIGVGAVRVLGGYARGTALVALVDATFIGAGLLILRVPLAIPLAVLMFGTAFIPVVGSIFAGLVAALVALVTGGPVSALLVIALVVVVNQLEGNLLQPVVMGRTVSLHPLAILLALAGGTVLGGIVGALLAVPVASVAWVAIKSWNPGDPEMDALEEVPAKA